jgi:hypothetical protein
MRIAFPTHGITRRTPYSLLVRIGVLDLMDETDEKSIRPLRFGVAGRKLMDHGCLPLVKVKFC